MYLLFTIAKTLKQPKCTLTEEWTKKMWEKNKMWYICTMGYYSAIKKEWNNGICSVMNGPRYHTKWRKSDKVKSDKDIYHETSLIHGI